MTIFDIFPWMGSEREYYRATFHEYIEKRRLTMTAFEVGYLLTYLYREDKK